MTVWGSGRFSATAFHTVWHSDDGDNFAREVVTYETGSNPDVITDEFVHAVQHFHTGHHELRYSYPLEILDE